MTTYRFHDRYGAEIRQAQLTLRWEADGDAMSDDWTPDEIDATDLLWRWWEAYGKDSAEKHGLPEGHVPIFWFVDVEGPDRQTFEFAPFAQWHGAEWDENFLTFFAWPVNEDTGDRLRWPELPVADKLWRAERGDKGGFIQETLGWKPSAYQASFDPLRLARAAGLPR